jgi:hypothetical protein
MIVATRAWFAAGEQQPCILHWAKINIIYLDVMAQL